MTSFANAADNIRSPLKLAASLIIQVAQASDGELDQSDDLTRYYLWRATRPYDLLNLPLLVGEREGGCSFLNCSEGPQMDELPTLAD
jgi:hypothetical protein